MEVAGSSTTPLKFIGYQTTPGDITSSYFDHGDAIRNSNFHRTKYSVYSWGPTNATTPDSPLYDNKILNCNFYQSTYFWRQSKTDVQNLEITNCNIVNVANSPPDSDFSGVVFTHDNFVNSWGVESGTGNMSADPAFADPGNGDFSLLASSPVAP